MHKKSIKLSDVECQTNTLNLPSDFPDDIIKLIKQALSEKIALTKYSCDDAYDFSHYIFPACRALEGTIKYLFEINITLFLQVVYCEPHLYRDNEAP